MDPTADTLTSIALVISAIGSLVGALAAAYGVIVSKRNTAHIKSVEHATNGMKRDLVEEVRKAATAAGVKQGHEEATAAREQRPS